MPTQRHFPPIPEAANASGTTGRTCHLISRSRDRRIRRAGIRGRRERRRLTDGWPLQRERHCLQGEFFDRRGTAGAAHHQRRRSGLMPMTVYRNARRTQGCPRWTMPLITLHVLSAAADYGVTILNATGHRPRTFFELAVIRSLRALVLQSRPLRPTDSRLQQEARNAEDAVSSINVAMITEVRAALAAVQVQGTTFFGEISTTLSGPDEEAITIGAVTDIDLRIREFIDAASTLSRFGFSGTGIGDSLEWRRVQVAGAIAKLETGRSLAREALDVSGMLERLRCDGFAGRSPRDAFRGCDLDAC